MLLPSLAWLAIPQAFVWLLWFSSPGLSRSLSAWYTGLGAPQLAMYDNSTGKIFYSLCNSNGTPVFPANDTAALHLDIPPANDTSVAGVGYQQEGINIAAIHYISKSGGIVQALYHCDETGHYEYDDSWIVSSGVDPPIRPYADTDLAAVLLGESSGYRIYYKDEGRNISTLQYTINASSEGKWSYGGHVSQEEYTGRSIQAGFVNRDRVTVISSLVAEGTWRGFTALGYLNLTVQICTSRDDEEWSLTSFPYESNERHEVISQDGDDEDGPTFIYSDPTSSTDSASISYNITGTESDNPLKNYNGDAAKLGLAFGATAVRSFFYIGSDSSLYQFQETTDDNSRRRRRRDDYDDSSSKWRRVDPPEDTDNTWPRADTPNPDFAVTFDSDLDKIWIYYVVNESMTQVHQSSAGVWEPAAALPKFNATAALDEPPADDGAASGDDNGSGGGLSSGGKVGVGVGVGLGLGLPIGVALVAAYAFWHARRSRQSREAEFAAVQDAHAAATSPGDMTGGGVPSFVGTGSPAPGYTSSGYWSSGGGGGGGGEGYWANGQWVQISGDGGAPPSEGQLYGPGGKSPESQQFLDPRFSQLLYYGGAGLGEGGGGGGGAGAPPVHEMPHQEPAYEVAGDGLVSEMPGSPQAQQPASTPSPALVSALAPVPAPAQRAVSPMVDSQSPPPPTKT